MSTNAHSLKLSTTTHRAAHGAAGGLAGGIVFGMLMQMMGMIGMVAQFVGSSSTAVGWLVHLAISAAAGIGYAVVLGPYAKKALPAALLGMAYGVVWWVVGALFIMPRQLGMPVFELNTTAWQSLMGHLVFGLVLGLAYARLRRAEHG